MAVDERIGEILGGHYRLTERIGAGGQSVVYRAQAITGGRDVAVKVMRGAVATDPNARERMSREAVALMNLKSAPAALKIYGQYWTHDNCMSLITELLDGVDLDKYLEQHQERLEVGELLELLPPVIDTLDAAHRQGVVHRDIKPGNIFIVSQPRSVRLLDFGFAKFLRLRSFTLEGSVAGSPRYVAPEAWFGRKDLDERIDVYSLGALIFRCLAGRCPFEKKSMVALLEAVTREPRPSLHLLRPDLPQEVDDWVEIVLAVDREKRFQNVRAMWNAFVNVVG